MNQNTFVLTPDQVARTLQINQAMVYKMIKNGELVAKKLGKRLYRISPIALSWIVTGLDYDITKMEKEDQRYLKEIYSLLKSVRKEG